MYLAVFSTLLYCDNINYRMAKLLYNVSASTTRPDTLAPGMNLLKDVEK